MISYSGTGLTISETLQTNAIVWIHSLPEGEMGPTRRILEDLDGLAGPRGLPVVQYKVGNSTEFIKIFDELTVNAEQGLRPILHVDAHGTENDGLLLSPSGERIEWSDIIEYLRILNVATNNNLTCVFALCFGLHLYKQVSLKEPVPAYFFVAPPSEINVGFLEDNTLAFYREVNHTSNVTDAFNKTLAMEMESIHCQGLFLQSLLRYIRKYCTRKQRQERQELIVTTVLEREGIVNPTSPQLRRIRQYVRQCLKPGQHLIDQFEPSFLLGRSAAFAYNDLEAILQQNLPPKSTH